MKKIVIEFHRHSVPNSERTGITANGAKNAEILAAIAGPFDLVFSADNGFCVETAMNLGNKPEEKVDNSRVFNDLGERDMIESRIAEMTSYILVRAVDTIGVVQDVVKALVVASSNLISAMIYFNEGKETPEDLIKLPPVDYLAGTDITILFG